MGVGSTSKASEEMQHVNRGGCLLLEARINVADAT